MVNRLLYNSQAVFASLGLSNNTALNELQRVLSINHGASITRQDVTVFGSRAPIDRVIVDAPTVSVDLSYLVLEGHNENALGLYVNDGTLPSGTAQSGLLTNLLNGSRDEQNYFIKVVDVDQDADATTATTLSGIIGFGNASLASYSVEARLGGFATATTRLAGLNLTYEGGSSYNAANPAINPTDGSPLVSPDHYVIPATGTYTTVNAVNAIRPGDITLELPTIFALGSSPVCPQSFTLTVDLAREALRCLGTKFRYANEINFPLNATLSVEVLVRDLSQNDKLTKFLCSDQDEASNFDIKLRKPATCDGANDEDLPDLGTGTTYNRDTDNFLVFTLKGARFDSITFNNGVGNGETATVNYSVSIGSPNDTAHNIFVASTQMHS